MAHRSSEIPILLSDTATKFDQNPSGAVVVTASHGGRYPAILVGSLGVRAAVFNDAGGGRDAAGIAGLGLLQEYGIAAAAVSCLSARIGDGGDMMRRGVISHSNALAQALGCVPGLPCSEAARSLRFAERGRPVPPPPAECRRVLLWHGAELACIDSASLVRPDDAARFVITGSHGGLLGGDARTALRYDALAAVYNDAGIGADRAGMSRLPALDARGIPACTVSSGSARIGEAMSTFTEGILSAVNDVAASLEAREGMCVADFLHLLRQRRR